MPEKKDRCVRNVKKRMTEKYIEKTGHAPSKEKAKEIENSAWAICTKQLGTLEEGGDASGSNTI